MKTIHNGLRKFLICSGVLFAWPVSAHRVGNGGDHIRATYIQMGQSVLDYLEQTQEGASVLQREKISSEDLRASLDINKIIVSDDILRDNSGSIVEALGVPGLVTLQKNSWFSFFEKSSDVYFLVFHEMLRSAGVDDDNYVISKALLPFPSQRKVATKVTPLVPLIDDDSLSSLFDLSKVSVNGSGCPLQLSGTQVSFDSEVNVLEISTRQYRTESLGLKSIQRKNCAMAVPIKLPAKKRLVISQIDLRGQVDLQMKSQTQVSFEAFLVGKSNSIKTKVVKPSKPGVGLKGRFQMRRTDVMKSFCGGSDILRLNSALLTDFRGGDSSVAASESSEIGTLQVFLSLEDCL